MARNGGRSCPKALLKSVVPNLPEGDLQQLHDGMYDLARIVVDQFMLMNRSQRARAAEESEAMRLVPVEMRDAVEERAAILEFDGRVPRDFAVRASFKTLTRRMSVPSEVESK